MEYYQKSSQKDFDAETLQQFDLEKEIESFPSRLKDFFSYLAGCPVDLDRSWLAWFSLCASVFGRSSSNARLTSVQKAIQTTLFVSSKAPAEAFEILNGILNQKLYCSHDLN
jgi:hypothetical protein